MGSMAAMADAPMCPGQETVGSAVLLWQHGVAVCGLDFLATWRT